MDEGASPNRTNIFKKITDFMKKPSKDDDVTEEEIISMVNEGHEQGVLRASEAEMIHNIFEFGDKEAKDIMTHRKNLIAIDGELSYNDAVHCISSAIDIIYDNRQMGIMCDIITNTLSFLCLASCSNCKYKPVTS